MDSLALTGLYAGSIGLAMLKLPVVRASTDLLASGSSSDSGEDRSIVPGNPAVVAV
jgi:hypothetical protein